MVGRQPDVFVQIEGRDAAEIQAFLPMQTDQLSVEAQGRSARRQTKHRIGFPSHQSDDDAGAEQAAGFGRLSDENFHGKAGQAAAMP